jgi:hypothetical protein
MASKTFIAILKICLVAGEPCKEFILAATAQNENQALLIQSYNYHFITASQTVCSVAGDTKSPTKIANRLLNTGIALRLA